jgi:hypothetical protein
MTRTTFLAGVFLSLATFVHGQTALPLVEEAEWEPLRMHCRELIKALDAHKLPLPTEKGQALRALLDDPPRDPEKALREVQKLLDEHCLLGVTINPESRVKAQRGPLAAELVRGRPILVLVKVQNDGGVTHPLTVAGAEVVREGVKREGAWLEADLVPLAPGKNKLSGRRVEYVVLRLTAREAGKREATFQFDVGQGTQDLGFRAEVPVLFAVRER